MGKRQLKYNIQLFTSNMYSLRFIDSFISIFDIEENVFDTSVTRIDGSLTVAFSRSITTTDNITDISLDDSCLYLIGAVGNVISFIDRTQGAPTVSIVHDSVVCFPPQGLCPGI